MIAAIRPATIADKLVEVGVKDAVHPAAQGVAAAVVNVSVVVSPEAAGAPLKLPVKSAEGSEETKYITSAVICIF